jgi:hypothetical protein
MLCAASAEFRKLKRMEADAELWSPKAAVGHSPTWVASEVRHRGGLFHR